MTESKVRAEEQPQKPQQQPLQLAASEEEAHLSLAVYCRFWLDFKHPLVNLYIKEGIIIISSDFII